MPDWNLPLSRIPLLLAATLAVLRAGVAPGPALADHEIMIADGDTLSVIALMWYGDSSYADTIAAYNHLTDPDNLSVGQVLRLPDIPNTTLAQSNADSAAHATPTVTAGLGSGGEPDSSPLRPIVQMGLATWYGPGFEGQTTKCGQTFHTSALTASSNDLPCGAVIDVMDVANGRHVVVTVDDTGAFQHPTILDLTPAAFGTLASPDTGVLEVAVSRLR